ncbi:hypothetical protein ACFSRY_16945 [Pontibacter locisalis]|uniref:Outer membrane protein beta-barrel domain-containing protein n=1 Tax=Pontibacter locisalis TaxID=1719035 RepID=A0ABW5IQ40_9BACT
MLTDKEQEEIRRKLLGLEEAPPADGWSKISAQVQPKRPPQWKWWVVSAALLLLLATTGIYYLEKEKTGADLSGTGDSTEPLEVATSVENTGSDKESKLGFSISSSKKSEAGIALPNPHKTTRSSEPTDRIEKKRQISEATPGTGRVEAYIPVQKQPQNSEFENKTIVVATAEVIDENENDIIDKMPGVKPVVVTSEEFVLLASLDSVKLNVGAAQMTTRAEADTSTSGKKKEWFIGSTFASRYAFRSFTPTGADEIYITNLNTRNQLDPERLGFEFGVNIGKSLKPNLFLETHLSLVQLQENVSYSFTTGKVDTLLKSVSSDGKVLVKPVLSESERQLKSSFTYGGMRMGVTYYFLQRAQSRLNLTVAGGVNVLLKGRTKEYVDGELAQTIVFPTEQNPLEQTNYNLLLGLGYNVAVLDKYELMLMPNLNYFLASTYQKREPFGLKPYSFGLSMQFSRRFKK